MAIRLLDHHIDVVEIVDGTCVVWVAGALDDGAVSALEDVLLPLAERHGCQVVLDLGAVDSIDHRGVDAIAGAAAHSRSNEGDLVIVVREAELHILLADVAPLERTLQDGIARTIRSKIA